ncbi:MAG: histidine-type phosphatase [Segniliparus sp.]|uniref:histidine-type phosphatase n=1 Tax=Segniliparus sp. TaxID=2804064 RepID=UPI003F2E4E8F
MGRRSLAMLAALILGTVCAAPAGADGSGQSYGTKAIADYFPGGLPPAPGGYRLVFVETLTRHGARGLSSAKYDDLTIKMVESARSRGQLTPAGEQLGVTAQRIAAANVANGYGNLTEAGRRQMRDLASRTAARDREALRGPVALQSSGEPRATASAQAFGAALAAAVPEASVGEPEVRTDLLYFHNTDAAYKSYVKTDPDVAAAVKQVDEAPAAQAAARSILLRAFAEPFVDALADGSSTFVSSDGKTTVRGVVDAANMIYNLYAISPAMAVEGPFDLSSVVRPPDAGAFGFVSDGEDFIQKGPSLAGRDATFAMARPLLVDFLRQAREGTGSLFRFSHAEEVIPFLALLRVPGSDRQLPLGQQFSYAATGWYGFEQSPLGASVEWQVFRDGAGGAQVRMLLDGKPTRYGPSCVPATGFFYALSELERCYS